MVTIEVHSYSVALVPAMDLVGTARAQHPVIFLYDATGRFFARVNFRPPEDLMGAQYVNLETLPLVFMTYPSGDYPVVLDILRNEKPVYLRLEGTHPILSTSQEPVGDGEV